MHTYTYIHIYIYVCVCVCKPLCSFSVFVSLAVKCFTRRDETELISCEGISIECRDCLALFLP